MKKYFKRQQGATLTPNDDLKLISTSSYYGHDYKAGDVVYTFILQEDIKGGILPHAGFYIHTVLENDFDRMNDDLKFIRYESNADIPIFEKKIDNDNFIILNL